MPRLGVLGTLVLDTIHRPGVDGDALTDWGGIAYSLAALEAVAPIGWDVFPLIKVGADLRQGADEFFDGLERVESLDGVLTVPEPNNRVDLYYSSKPRRCERLTGGVPGWTWSELAGTASSCDALIVNFIAGWEIDLETAGHLRSEYGGSVYADIHSLLLAVGPDGVRSLRPLPEWPEWRQCFDVVQMNEEELSALAQTDRDPADEARDSVLHGPETLFVTHGAAGSRWYVRAAGGVHEGEAPTEPVAAEVSDPTGCGDVWGAACASSLLAGADAAGAAERANRLAGLAARHRGTKGLAMALQSETGSGGRE
ncbi:MAG: carbohydrate kinase family protein [Gemmatimonadetes bacterium]|nr:carbohydrate kinase family protein [Gemmatimonadota bacterium]